MNTCITCGKPMRPTSALSADYPGTVRHDSHGRCASCVQRERRHTVTPEQTRHNRAMLGYWLADRRRRLAHTA